MELNPQAPESERDPEDVKEATNFKKAQPILSPFEITIITLPNPDEFTLIFRDEWAQDYIRFRINRRVLKQLRDDIDDALKTKDGEEGQD